MDKKTILNQIKKLISFSGTEVFKDAKLIDGETIIKVDAENFEVGLPLFVVTPDGLIPAPTGEHTTQDGYKIVVDEAGIITSVEEVEVAEEVPLEVIDETMGATASYEEHEPKEEEEEKDPEEMGKKMDEMKKKYAAMEERITEVEKMMNEMLPVIKESAEFGNDVLGKLDNFIKDTPAQKEFSSIKSEYKQFVRENKERQFSGLEGIRNIRKK